MQMKNPPHPGRIVREEIIEAFGLTVGEAAEALGVSRPHLSQLLNGKAGISPEMAIRLSKALGNGNPDFWLRLQKQYELAQALKDADKIKVKKLKAKPKVHEAELFPA